MYYPEEKVVWAEVQKLVKSITGKQDDDEICDVVDYMTAALCFQDCPVPNEKEIRENLEGIALKFYIHGFSRLSLALETELKNLLQSSDLESQQPFLTWNMLKLLRELSWKPMDHAHEEAIAKAMLSEHDTAPAPDPEKFDWGAHLREGNESFELSDDEDSGSNWSQLTDDDDEEEEEEIEAGVAEEPDMSAPSTDHLTVLFNSPRHASPKITQDSRRKRKTKKRTKRLNTTELDQDSDEWSQLSGDDDKNASFSPSFRESSTRSSSRSSTGSFSIGNDVSQSRPILTSDARSDTRSTASLKMGTEGSSQQSLPTLAASESQSSLCSLGMILAASKGSTMLTPFPDNPFVTDTNFLARYTDSQLDITQPPTGAQVSGKPAMKPPVNQELLQVYAAAFKAESEIDDMTQDCDWFAASKLTALPGRPDDSVSCLYFPTVGTHGAITVLPEYHVLRDFLWMLLAPAETRCFGQNESGNFKPRPDFTIINIGVFGLWSLLDNFCPYFDMIADFQSFRADIYNHDGDTGPPETYKAYWTALRKHIAVFTATVAKIMKRVAKQESINTLLSVTHELKPSLDELAYMHQLHKKAVCDWRNEDNWFSAIRLLSVLYQEFGPSQVARRSLSLDLYIKSLQPYLNIIHSWLTFDVDIDFRDEFIICRGSDMETSMQDTWHEGVVVRPYVLRLRGIAPPPSMLHLVVDQIVLGCKSIYLLRLMDQLHTGVQKYSKSMYLDLLASLTTEFSRYSSDPSALGDSGCPSDQEVEGDQQPEPAILKLSVEMTANLTDVYLLHAVREFIEGEKEVVVKEEEKVEERWLKIARHLDAHHHLMERCMSALVNAMYQPLGRHVSAILKDKMCLELHLDSLRKTFFLEAADITALFINQITQKRLCAESCRLHILDSHPNSYVKDEPCWMYSHVLTCHLGDCFADSLTDGSRFRVIIDNRFMDKDVMSAVEGIEITYAVEWPLSLLVKPNLPLYNEIFRMLLKLKWTLSSLECLRFDEQKAAGERTKCVRRLVRWQTLRFWLLNAVTGAHNFTMSHVVHSFGPELDALIQHGEDFDNLVRAHCDYLRTIHQLCVNPFEGSKLKVQFDHLLSLAQCVVDDWKHSNRASFDTRLAKMEDVYCNIHCAIGRHLADFVPLDSRINTDSLLSVFYYPLKPTLGRVTIA